MGSELHFKSFVQEKETGQMKVGVLKFHVSLAIIICIVSNDLFLLWFSEFNCKKVAQVNIFYVLA